MSVAQDTPIVGPVAARPRLKLPTATLVGGAIVLPVILCALFPQAIAPYDPNIFDYRALMNPPSLAHPFGTDNFGRDILSRVIWGTRIDLQIAMIGVVFPFLIGTTVGTVAGFFGGPIDAVFMRLVDIILAFPFRASR